MPYTVNDRTFKTKADVTRAANTVRDSVAVGDEIVGPDRDFILDLLTHHSDAGDKMRDGITCLSTMRNAYGTVSFKVTRSDGTHDDFSIGTCVTGLPRADRR